MHQEKSACNAAGAGPHERVRVVRALSVSFRTGWHRNVVGGGVSSSAFERQARAVLCLS